LTTTARCFLALAAFFVFLSHAGKQARAVTE
jgi:hypothetical protein